MLILGSNQVLLLYVLDCVFTLGNVVRDLVQRGGRLALAYHVTSIFKMAILH